MIKYIHHISDIHIRLLKRHSEYREVFDNLYEKIKENADNSIIVVTGDIVHSKLEMSPELVNLTGELFTNLSKISKVLIIPGNHDCLLNNPSRLDTLTPIIENLNNKNIIYSKNTELIQVDNIEFAHQSIFSSAKDYIKPHEMTSDKIKIALFHGVVNGADFGGFTTKSGEVEASDFDGFNMVLLGDIHMSQKIQSKNLINNKPEIWYAGSLVQNNYGEDLDKGYLLWDVESETPTFIKIENDYGYHTVNVENGNYIIPKDFSKKPRIRLKVRNTPSSDINRISTDLRKVFEVQEIIVNNLEHTTNKLSTLNKKSSLDIRNIQIQNDLIRTHIKNKHQILDEDLINKVISINDDTNKGLLQNDTVRNISWAPKTLEFDNMFSYGGDNKINFGKLKNIIGLFAPNAHGKSSLVDVLTFCIFDKSSRASKGSNILNNKKNKFYCKFNFEIDGADFWIERIGYKQKSGNVKVDVNFWTVGDDGNEINLNGSSRDETNQNIRGYLGTYDDFISTALSFQGNYDSFIEKSQTERKDFLSKFLDISIFDDLYNISNEKTKELKILLSEYKKQDFSEKLSELEIEYANNKKLSEDLNVKKKELENEKLSLDSLLLEKVQSKLKTNFESINVDKLEYSKKINTEKINELEIKISEYNNIIVDNKTKAVSLFEKIKNINKNEIIVEYNKLIDLRNSYNKKNSEFQIKNNDIDQKKKILEDLKNHEYDPNCKYCMNNIFVKNAIKTKNEIDEDEVKFIKIKEELSTLELEVEKLEYSEKEYDTMMSISEELDNKKLIALKNENEMHRLESEIKKYKLDNNNIDDKIKEYEINKESIEFNKLIDIQISEIKNKMYILDDNKKSLEKKIQEATSEYMVNFNEIGKINNLISNASNMEEKFKSYELYSKCVNRDGLPYDLILNTIPVLQDEVNDILSQIVDFNIIFNLDGKNVNAFIVYDDNRYWPIEMCSGMEKFISSLAIRCAMLNISNLPRPTFLIIDEGFGVLDSDNINSVGYLFDYLKQKFEFVLIVSHIDNMKDMVDYSLEISKEGEFSKIIHF